VKIYATDIDEEALLTARQATYSEQAVENLAPELLEKYFTRHNEKFVFRSDLRRSIIFGRHDIVQDAPISQLDLLICRNTLMYLNAETQSRIIARMHFALKQTGYLFLGKAEMLLSHASLFAQVDLRHRVFSKVNKTNLRDRLLVMAQAGDVDAASYLNKYSLLGDLSLEGLVQAQIAIDRQGVVCLANERARSMFGLGRNVIGSHFQDLEISYRPVELRSLIDQCYREERGIRVTRVARQLSDSVQLLDVLITPLTANDGSGIIGASITFEDLSEFHQLNDQLRSTHEELETTNEELQSTNQELETTNEELQSANEELETTNEELQSTNEELETTNEELQSTNEELETTNEELRSLGDEVHATNTLFESILASINSAVIVVDPGLKVRAWNHKAEDMWGLRADEVFGASLTGLDIGLPTDQLGSLLAEPDGDGPRQLQMTAINRRGKKVLCTVRVTSLLGTGRNQGSVIFIDDTPGEK
jgi:two-component system CheB/CheR fusion protein